MQKSRMFIILCVLIIMFSAAAVVSAQLGQGSLSYGDTVVGNLTSSNGDTWTFQGSAGDSVTISLDSDDFDPVVELYTANDSLLTSDDDGGGNFNSLISNFVLPSDGQYSILARGYVGTARGEYTLSLDGDQDTQNGDGGGNFSGGEIRYGGTVNENLTTAAGDRWAFEGTNGDLISISLTSTEFDPYLELVGIDGAILTSDDDGGNGLNSRISRFALPSTGTYAIVVRGFSDTERGAYTLSLTLTDNFVTGEIGYDEEVTGELRDSVGEFWAFEGSAGDFATIYLTSEDFDTYLELLSPNGAQLANNDDIDGAAGDRNSLIDRVQLPTDGTYTIVVRGYLDTARGDYTLALTNPNLTATSTNGTSSTGGMVYGETVNGNLSSSEGDAWTFEGAAGDVVTISLDSQVFDTYVVLQDSSGTELVVDDNSGTSLNALVEGFELPETGTYTIVARGTLSSDRGTYTLTLQTDEVREAVSGNNPVSIGTVSRGIAVTGTVTTDAGDGWTFAGKGGEAITIAANSDFFNTYLEIFDASGELIAFNDDSGPRLNALIEGVELPADGDYTIIVRSFLPGGRGDYSLIVQDASPASNGDVVTVSDDVVQVSLDADATVLPNSVVIATVDVATLQEGVSAYCVNLGLGSDVYTLLSAETVELGEVASSDGVVTQFEVLVSTVETGQLTLDIQWFDSADCSGTPHTLTAQDQITVSAETWQIGVDVYPSCSLEGDILVSIINTDGQSMVQPQTASEEPYSTIFSLPAEAATYYVHAQATCLTSDGTQIPRVYSRVVEVDQDRQRFNVGLADSPPDGQLP